MNTMKNLKQEFGSTFSLYDAPVPLKVLEELLFVSKNPETGAVEDGFGYSPKDIETVLRIGISEKHDIEGLKGFLKPLYIASAGGPGAGKSTALFQYVSSLFNVDVPKEAWHESSLSEAMSKIFTEVPAALVSPDRRGILSLALKNRDEPTSDRAFYLKWRWASNFLSNVALNVAFQNRRNIVHDTTLSGRTALDNLKALKNSGYCLAVFMQGAPLRTREEAADKRNETFFQSLKGNVTDQDTAFAEKISQIVPLTDLAVIGWRNAANEEAKQVAKIANGTLLVLDEEGFERYCSAYPQMAELKNDLKVVGDADFHDPLKTVVTDIAAVMASRNKPFFPKKTL